MNHFFDKVARHLLDTIEGNMLNMSIVFPNRRGGVYFTRSLSANSNGRIVAPKICTLSDCFSSISHLMPADDMLSMFMLYKVNEDYDREHTPLTRFWNLAPLLLENMNDWDMYLTDVKGMLRESTTWSKMGGDFSFLTEEQRKAIEEFWGMEIGKDIGRQHSEEWWNRLLYLYENHRRVMTAEGYGDDGMIARDAIGKIQNDTANIEGQIFVFVGFNELNGAAMTFMREMKRRGQAIFYWDYDLPQAEQRAQKVVDKYPLLFKDRNKQLFPDSLPRDINNTNEKPIVHQIAVNSKTGLSKFTSSLLGHIATEQQDLTGTCLLLTHTDDLLPLLTTLPDSIPINITMQMALRTSNVYGWISALFDTLSARRTNKQEAAFYYLPLTHLLVSPLTQYIDKKACDTLLNYIRKFNQIAPMIPDMVNIVGKNNLLATFLTELYNISNGRDLLTFIRHWSRHITNSQERQYHDDKMQGKEAHRSISHEMLKALLFSLNVLNEQINGKYGQSIVFDTTTMRLLIITHCQNVSLNFVGHPLHGVQIMGPLEARGLDMQRLIIVGAGEQSLLKHTHKQQLVPPSVRYAYGLPTPEDENAVAAYNFLRMMGHTKEVYFLWDSRQSNNDRGEMSHLIKIINDIYGITPNAETDKGIIKAVNGKDDNTMPVNNIDTNFTYSLKDDEYRSLRKYLKSSHCGKHLSPSAINTYISCKLKFYFKYIVGIYPKKEMSEDVEATSFGTMFHNTMDYLYRIYTGKTITKSDIKGIIADEQRITDAIHYAYNLEYHSKSTKTHTPEGQYLLACEAVRTFVINQLEKDLDTAPFIYIGAEIKIYGEMQLASGDSAMLEGILDRVDIVNGDTLRIIDYKTSRITSSIDNKYKLNPMSTLFDPNKERPEYGFQTLMYTMLINNSNKYRDIVQGKTLQPHVFLVCMQPNMHPGHQSMVTADYIHDMKSGDEEITENGKKIYTVTNVREYFESHLKATLENMFDSTAPIMPTSNQKACTYCEFINLCNTLKHKAQQS